MRESIKQHIRRILLDLRSHRETDAGITEGERKLRLHLEKIPYDDLLSLNAVMYAGRDGQSPRNVEQQLGRSGVFSKDELIQAMLMRFDGLQNYLVQGAAQERVTALP